MSPADMPEPPPKVGTGDVWIDIIDDVDRASMLLWRLPRWFPLRLSMWNLRNDMARRRAFGIQKHGTPLQYDNGRRPRVDLYQELLDACAYARQGHEPWWIRWPIVALAWVVQRRLPPT